MADTAKVERATAKRLLTVKSSAIKRLLVEDKIDNLAVEKQSLTDLFAGFEAKHNVYHGLISNDNEILESELYFLKEQD